MSDKREAEQGQPIPSEPYFEGREAYDMDIDRMVNEGLGGGQVTMHNGLIADSTTDFMLEPSEDE